MTRADLIANERTIAATYRREAAHRGKNPELQAQLLRWAEASDARAECLRAGPLFEVAEPSAAGAKAANEPFSVEASSTRGGA